MLWAAVRQNETTSTFVFEAPPVRLGEFDMGGVLYHAHYFHLYEQTREAFLKYGGVSYPSLVNNQTHLAVVESHQVFKSPIRYGEPVIIGLHTSEITRTTVIFNYNILNPEEKDKSIHTAWTKHVFVDTSPGQFRISKFPEKLSAHLSSISQKS